MGMQKHRKSGHIGPTARYKQTRARDANTLAQQQAELHKRPPTFHTVCEALASRKHNVH